MEAAHHAPPPPEPGQLSISAIGCYEGHIRTLDNILAALDQILLTFRTAWNSLNNLCNEAVVLRALLRRVADMLSPQAGIKNLPNYEKDFRDAVDPPPRDCELRLWLLQEELVNLSTGSISQLLRWRQDHDQAWNQSFIRGLTRNWMLIRERIEKALNTVKFLEFVSADALYNGPGESSSTSPRPGRRKKRKKKAKAKLKDCSTELDEALHNKDFAAISKLLEGGADPDLPLKDESCLMFQAVKSNTVPLIRLLHKYGADPDITHDDKMITPLHLACQMAAIAPGIALMDIGANIHAKQFQGVQPLALAAAWKRLTLVQHLLAKRADPNDSDSMSITPLGTAILTKIPPVSLDIVDCLLTYGARATSAESRLSPIHEAVVRRDDKSLARLLKTSPSLVDHKCVVGMQDCKPLITPMVLALSINHQPAVKRLVASGADVNYITRFAERRETYPLIAIETNAPLSALKTFLRAGADPNTPNDSGRTPLHAAAETPAADIAATHLLLQHGADVRAVTHTNANAPLHMAVRSARADVAQALLEAGADVDARLKSGASAFMLAAFRGNLTMLRFLHRRGAAAAYTLPIGETAMHGACRRGQVACAAFLASVGLSVDAAPELSGFAPLHAAASRGQADMVRWLVEQGADVRACMRTEFVGACLGKGMSEAEIGGGSVLEVARAFGHAKVVAYLEKVLTGDDEVGEEGDGAAVSESSAEVVD